MGYFEGRKRLKLTPAHLIWLPCLTAPLSVLMPWAIVPSKMLGLGTGGFSFFLAWLTKYPNRFGFNLEVGLGFLSCLAVGFLPLFWAILTWQGVHKRLAHGIMICYIASFIAVFARLDMDLYAAVFNFQGLSGEDGAMTLLGPILHTLPLATIVAKGSEKMPRF